MEDTVRIIHTENIKHTETGSCYWLIYRMYKCKNRPLLERCIFRFRKDFHKVLQIVLVCNVTLQFRILTYKWLFNSFVITPKCISGNRRVDVFHF